MEFILLLQANRRFPSLAVQVTESASGRFRSLGEAPVGGVLGGNWSSVRWLGAYLQIFCTFLVKNSSVVDVSPFSH